MIVYTVHEPFPPASSIEDRAETITFVREGFTWLGFLFPLPWLLINRLWFEFIAAMAIMAGLGALISSGSYSSSMMGLIGLLLNVLVGFEGRNLVRWKLERSGYTFLTSVAGRDFAECERRFFEAWYPLNKNTPKQAQAAAASEGPEQPTPFGPQSWSPAQPVIATLPGRA